MERALINQRHGVTGTVICYWAPVALYAGVIFYFSAQSHPEEHLPEFFIKQISDKLLHVMEFALLAGLCYRAFRWAGGSFAARRAVVLAIVTASGYGLTDELHQWFVPLRESSWMDWIADTIGALVGAAGWSRVANGTGDER
ncbi:MAG TPA: VanZ family protein [Nitrospira sp.]|nr:VanZ family protein [Nitrospira sp.]